MNFHVGQKVVCIDAPGPKNDFERRLMIFAQKGAVYTIRSMLPAGDEIGLRFFEIRNPEVFCFDVQQVLEPAFRASLFRPLIERSTETGMAVLRQILADHKTPVKEKV